MRTNSLAVRLFLWATAWTVVILIITGVALSTLYRHAVERAFDRRLDVYLRTLVADVASPEDSGDKFLQSIGEPLFELPLSGWYWQVTRLDSKTPEVHSSRSLWDSNLPRLAADRSAAESEYRQGYARGPEDQDLRLVERSIDLGAQSVLHIGQELNSFAVNEHDRRGANPKRLHDRRRLGFAERGDIHVIVSERLAGSGFISNPVSRSKISHDLHAYL